MLIGLIAKAERESREASAILAYLHGKQIRHVAASQNPLHLLLNSLQGKRFPWGIGAALFQWVRSSCNFRWRLAISRERVWVWESKSSWLKVHRTVRSIPKTTLRVR